MPRIKLFISSVQSEFAEERQMLVDCICQDALRGNLSGHLPFGMTIEKLKGPHKSMPTNPLIADPMYWCGYIEKLGTGTEDILKKCSAYGLKHPDFQQDEDFKVTFWRNESETVADGDTVTGETVLQETTQKTTRKILECIMDNEFVSRKDLAEMCGISQDGIKWQLRQMQQQGLIRRVGPDRGGHWEIIEK